MKLPFLTVNYYTLTNNDYTTAVDVSCLGLDGPKETHDLPRGRPKVFVLWLSTLLMMLKTSATKVKTATGICYSLGVSPLKRGPACHCSRSA
jgi:hypothetical protein